MRNMRLDNQTVKERFGENASYVRGHVRYNQLAPETPGGDGGWWVGWLLYLIIGYYILKWINTW